MLLHMRRKQAKGHKTRCRKKKLCVATYKKKMEESSKKVKVSLVPEVCLYVCLEGVIFENTNNEHEVQT